MINILVWSLFGFVNNLQGPNVVNTCGCADFIDTYGFRPYDFDQDWDVDLADFAIFQHNYDGTAYRQLVAA